MHPTLTTWSSLLITTQTLSPAYELGLVALVLSPKRHSSLYSS